MQAVKAPSQKARQASVGTGREVPVGVPLSAGAAEATAARAAARARKRVGAIVRGRIRFCFFYTEQYKRM